MTEMEPSGFEPLTCTNHHPQRSRRPHVLPRCRVWSRMNWTHVWRTCGELRAIRELLSNAKHIETSRYIPQGMCILQVGGQHLDCFADHRKIAEHCVVGHWTELRRIQTVAVSQATIDRGADVAQTLGVRPTYSGKTSARAVAETSCRKRSAATTSTCAPSNIERSSKMPAALNKALPLPDRRSTSRSTPLSSRASPWSWRARYSGTHTQRLLNEPQLRSHHS